MSKRSVISIVSALLLIVVCTGSYFVIRSMFSHAIQPEKVPITSTVVHQSEEVPVSTHRIYSTAAIKVATALTPWGIALDYKHGFVWVAEPGCTPNPKCPSIMQGNLSQYAMSDGNFITNFSEPGAFSSPLFLAIDEVGNVWFTEPSTDALGRYDPSDNS